MDKETDNKRVFIMQIMDEKGNILYTKEHNGSVHTEPMDLFWEADRWAYGWDVKPS